MIVPPTIPPAIVAALVFEKIIRKIKGLSIFFYLSYLLSNLAPFKDLKPGSLVPPAVRRQACFE